MSKNKMFSFPFKKQIFCLTLFYLSHCCSSFSTSLDKTADFLGKPQPSPSVSSSTSSLTDEKFKIYRAKLNKLLSQETFDDEASFREILQECENDEDRQQLLDLIERLTVGFRSVRPRQFRKILEDIAEIPVDRREAFTQSLIDLAKQGLSPVIDDLSFHLSSLDSNLFLLLKKLSLKLIRKYKEKTFVQSHAGEFQTAYRMSQEFKYRNEYISILKFLDENKVLKPEILVKQVIKLINCSTSITPLDSFCQTYIKMSSKSFRRRTNHLFDLYTYNPPFFSQDVLNQLDVLDKLSDQSVAELIFSTHQFVKLLKISNNFHGMNNVLYILASYNHTYRLAAAQALENIYIKIPHFVLNPYFLEVFMKSNSKGYDYECYSDIENYLKWVHKMNPDDLFDLKILKRKFDIFAQVPDRGYDQFFDHLRKKHNKLKRHST